jgi:hypothetical protein
MSSDQVEILAQRSSCEPNDRSKLSEEQLQRYENWKNQNGMAQIKLE